MSFLKSSSLLNPFQDLNEILIGKYFFLSVYTILLYDHLLTLPDEIRSVWKKKKTLPLCMFILVRYYALLSVTVVAFGYFSTEMTRPRCARWVLFLPLGITIPLTLFPGILMLYRVYALYNCNKIILYSLSTSLFLQTVAGLWEYTVRGSKPAPLPLDNYEYHFCIYHPSTSIGHFSIVYISWELGYDTVVFFLTITRTVYMYWKQQGFARDASGKSSLIGNLLRDGSFYFGCIFSVNLMWVMMTLHAPTGLRAIAAIPSACLNTIMVCRITLSLRTSVYGPPIFERTHNTIPLNELPNLLTGRSSQAPGHNNMAVRFQKDNIEDMEIHG